VFYVVAHDPARPFWAVQVDAMLISQRLGLPTVNGYSGGTPPGWTTTDPFDPTYGASISRWLDAHGLRSVACALDLGARTWEPPTP
jgi:hypothetical protein